MEILIPVSLSGLYDRYAILLIKSEKIKDKLKLQAIMTEMACLEKITAKNSIDSASFKSLYEINKLLWELENKIRLKEKYRHFDDEFIQLAREIYINNDRRFKIKYEIDMRYNSPFMDIKEYE